MTTSTEGAGTAGVTNVRGAQALRLLGRIWAWLFLLGLVAFFSLATPHFFDLFNFQAMGANTAVVLVLALGQTFVIITGGIDLSVGYVMGLATIVISLVMQNMIGYPLPLAVLAGFIAAMGVGLAAGLLNGVVIAKLQVSPFIATLGTLGIAQGIAFVLSGGPPVSIPMPGLGALGNGFVAYWHPEMGLAFFGLPEGVAGTEVRNVRNFVPLQILYAGALTAFCAWLLSSTKFGRHVYAIGGSAKAALRAGIPVRRNLYKVYILSSLMASMAGLMYVLRFTGGVANSGDALMLSSIAAIVIGGASLMGGQGRIIGTLVGAMIIAVIQNGLVLLGIDPFWQFSAVGAVIIMAVLADQAKSRITR